MKVTNVRVRLASSANGLMAYADIELDGELVIHEAKVIRGSHGLIVAMPSRKQCDHCPYCGIKNHLKAHFCNHCGRRQAGRREAGVAKFYLDTVHPVTYQLRQEIDGAVLAAYREAVASQPAEGYDVDTLEQLEARAD